RFHLHAVYLLSQHLASALEGLLNVKSATSDSSVEGRPKELLELLQMVTDLPMVFFPDEVEREQVPYIRYELSQNAATLVVETHDRRSAGVLPIASPFRVFFSTRGDGVSRKFSIPYMRPRDPLGT